MKRTSDCVKRKVAVCFLILVGFGLPAAAPARGGGSPSGRAWIYWSEARETESLRMPVAAPIVSERALQRMARTGAKGGMDHPANRPAPSGFLDHLARLGIRPRVVSRSLRAVSADLTPEQWRLLDGDPDVRRMQPVRTFRRDRGREESRGADRLATEDLPAGRVPADTVPPPESLSRADYGPSYNQCNQIDVTGLHRLGFSGRGVLVCVLDGGFLPNHEAFAGIDLVATRDFVGQDSIVSFEPTNPHEPNNVPDMNDHGTFTASALGGFRAGHLIGPAYRASLALGRTEIVETEIRLEEDTYVAGLEWADSLGADVVSTSLGYLDFADGFAYDPGDLDGRTAVTSIAAAWLAQRGVVLVTAMGNENRLGNPAPNLITPADAESVVSVGAVDSLGRVAGFSSRGPTADGRFKPDVCARGVRTVCATPGSARYTAVNGTSLATPLIGGLVTLLKEAHPEWNAGDVLRALHEAGSHAYAPDNSRGWGVPDGVRALGWVGPSAAGAGGANDLILERVSWVDQAAPGAEALSDTFASPAEEGVLTLFLRNRGTQPIPPVWASLRVAGAALPFSDSVRVGALAPGQGATVAGLHLRVDPDQPVPSQLMLVVRFRAEEGRALFRRSDLPVEPLNRQSRPYPNPVLAGGSIS